MTLGEAAPLTQLVIYPAQISPVGFSSLVTRYFHLSDAKGFQNLNLLSKAEPIISHFPKSDFPPEFLSLLTFHDNYQSQKPLYKPFLLSLLQIPHQLVSKSFQFYLLNTSVANFSLYLHIIFLLHYNDFQHRIFSHLFGHKRLPNKLYNDQINVKGLVG